MERTGERAVEAIMTSAVVSLDPDSPIGRARKLMLGLRLHGLPVVDRLGDVVGMVTSTDLVEEWPAGEPVSSIMSRRLVSIEATAGVEQAAALMVEHKIHHLVVTRNGRPVAVLSSLDLLPLLADG